MRYQTYKPPFWEPDPPTPIETQIAGRVPALDTDSDEEFEVQGVLNEDTNVLYLENICSSKRGWLSTDDPLFVDKEFEEYILDIYRHPDPWSSKYQVMSAKDYYYDPD